MRGWWFSSIPGFYRWHLVHEYKTWGLSNWWLSSGSALHFYLQPSTIFPAFLAAGEPRTSSYHSVSLYQRASAPYLWSRAKTGPTLSVGGNPKEHYLSLWISSANLQDKFCYYCRGINFTILLKWRRSLWQCSLWKEKHEERICMTRCLLSSKIWSSLRVTLSTSPQMALQI